MTRGQKTYVYQGKYAVMGGQNLNGARISVRPHVRLPASEVDPRTGELLPPKPSAQRNPRSQRQAAKAQPAKPQPVKAQAWESAGLKPPIRGIPPAKTREKGLSLSRALALMAVLVFLLGLSSLARYSEVTQQSKTVSRMRDELAQVRKETEDKRVELADLSKDTDVWYNASQKLGMISAKGVSVVYLTAPQAQSVSTGYSQADVPPARTGIYAALFGFLD